MAPPRRKAASPELQFEPPAADRETLLRRVTFDELEDAIAFYAALGYDLADWDALPEEDFAKPGKQLYYAMFVREGPRFCDGCKEQITAEADAASE